MLFLEQDFRQRRIGARPLSYQRRGFTNSNGEGCVVIYKVRLVCEGGFYSAIEVLHSFIP